MRCGRCGEENPARARFCLGCGAPLDDVPAQQQERKLVSVLFVDLVGFTRRSDGADPEDVWETLQAYHAAARGEIEQYGGTVEKFIGDAVMAVFGAPVSHGDDAERAIRAGLAVLAQVAGLGLEARAAVNTGEAVVAVGAAAAAGQALAMGDVVNTASRLQTSAPTGALVAGQETYRLTRQVISYERLDDVSAKGKAAAVPAWLVRGLSDAPVPRVTAPMVGRRRELDLLASIWEQAAGDRLPHLVTVLGPPGIGKSRLQREFSRSIQEGGAAVHRGRCLPYGERAAYGAFAQLVRGAAGIYENDSPEVAREKLRRLVTNLLPRAERQETAEYISTLIGVGGDAPVLQRDFLFYAARRLLECMATRRPVLLIFEDLHWAEGSLLDLIEYLAQHLRDARLMQVGLARPELLDRRPGWGGRLDAHTVVALEPLSAHDCAELAADLLAEAAGGASAARLAEAAEGNPLFVEELAAALAEGRGSAELPTSVRAAITARLDALPAKARAVLLDASVIGRTFWRGGVAALRPGGDLDGALAILEARDLVRRVPASRVRGDAEYIFKHVLIRDVAYATLPRAARRERHAGAARYVEGAAGDPGEHAALLAHHWREAGEPGRAIEYLLQAAEQAQRGWALTEALAHLDAALELAEDDSQRRRIRLARGMALSVMDEHDAAFRELGALLPELTGADRVEALLAHAWAAEWTERGDEAMSDARAALDLARALGDAELEAVATSQLGQAQGMSGQLDQGIETGRRALAIWVPGTRRWHRAQHYHLLGEALNWTGRLQEVEELMTEALAEAGDPQSTGARLRSASLRAKTMCERGRYEEGIALFEQTLALARELGRPVRIIQNYSTLPLRDLYDVGEATRRSEDSLALSVGAAGYGMPRAMAAADLVHAALLSGDLAAAENGWRQLWKDPEQLPNDWTRWLVRSRLAWARAELALLVEQPEEASEWAGTAIELARSVRRIKYEVLARTALGRALSALGKAPAAVAELRRAAAAADRLDTPAQRWPAWAALGDALYGAGDDAGAEAAFTTAGGVIRSMAAGLSSGRAETFLAAEPVREVIARAPAPA